MISSRNIDIPSFRVIEKGFAPGRISINQGATDKLI